MPWVKFQILDDPKQKELHFSKGKTTKDIKPYRLINGKKYNLPQFIIDHLHGCEYALYDNVIDPIDGQMRSTFTGKMSRFACVPTKPDVQAESDVKEEKVAASK